MHAHALAYAYLKRLHGQVSKIVFKTPIERVALFILAASLLSGLAILLEPAWSLRFRRGVHHWKIVPLLCDVTSVKSLADMTHHLAAVPTIAVVLLIAKTVVSYLLLPIMAFITTISNPLIARSVVILVGFPAMMLKLSCLLPKHLTYRLPGMNMILTWLVTAVVVGTLSARFPAVLRWAVSDMSMTVYLALLAAVLTGTMVQERLAVSGGKVQGQRKACNESVLKFTLYLLASVCAMWIIHCSDSGQAALETLRDVHRMR